MVEWDEGGWGQTSQKLSSATPNMANSDTDARRSSLRKITQEEVRIPPDARLNAATVLVVIVLDTAAASDSERDRHDRVHKFSA